MKTFLIAGECIFAVWILIMVSFAISVLTQDRRNRRFRKNLNNPKLPVGKGAA